MIFDYSVGSHNLVIKVKDVSEEDFAMLNDPNKPRWDKSEYHVDGAFFSLSIMPENRDKSFVYSTSKIEHEVDQISKMIWNDLGKFVEIECCIYVRGSLAFYTTKRDGVNYNLLMSKNTIMEQDAMEILNDQREQTEIVGNMNKKIMSKSFEDTRK